MNLSLFIARKYFFSKKKKNFINVISIISMVAMAWGTMALVIVLSVFNGLEDLLRSLHNVFDPELKITAIEGKSFEITEEFLNEVSNTEGVAIVTEIIEDNAYIRYRNDEMVVKIKGVGDNFIQHQRIDKCIVEGEFMLKDPRGIHYAVVGRGVQYALSINSLKNINLLTVIYPKRGRTNSLSLDGGTNTLRILPSGIFAIEKQYDKNYVFVPIEFAQELLEYGNRRTSLEIKVKEGYDIPQVQGTLKAKLGDKFYVRNSDEQHAELFSAIKIEKLFVRVTLIFILAIASFNIFFSLTMLAIDKKKDIAVLMSMGATTGLVKKIFYFEGLIISITGASIGLLLGFIVCYIQQTFGVISMGMETAVMDSYPVTMQASDFFYTSLSIVVITFIASHRPAVLASRVEIKDNL